MRHSFNIQDKLVNKCSMNVNSRYFASWMRPLFPLHFFSNVGNICAADNFIVLSIYIMYVANIERDLSHCQSQISIQLFSIWRMNLINIFDGYLFRFSYSFLLKYNTRWILDALYNIT